MIKYASSVYPEERPRFPPALEKACWDNTAAILDPGDRMGARWGLCAFELPEPLSVGSADAVEPL